MKVVSTKNNQQEFVYFHIKPFHGNEFWIEHRETIMKNLSAMYKKSISFAMTWNYSEVKFYAKIPVSIKSYFQNTFFANYPTSDLIEIKNPQSFNFIKTEWIPEFSIAEYIHFSEKDSMLSHFGFKKSQKYLDPMKDILFAFNEIPQSDVLTIFFVNKFKNKNTLWGKIKRVFQKIRTWKEKSSKNPENSNSSEKEKSRKEIYLSISYQLKYSEKFSDIIIKKNLESVFGAFCSNNEIKIKSFPQLKDMNIDQAVNFFHIPTKDFSLKSLDYLVYRKLQNPANIPFDSKNSEMTVLWSTDYRWEEKEFWILKEDKFRHMYIVWKTWTWKSTLISNMIKSDMNSQNWLCLLDPHWDLVEDVLKHIPTNRINDVILFDVADTEFPIGFNLLQYETEEEKNRIVSWVVSTFYKLFQHSRWPRLEYVLRNVLLSVIEYPNATLMHILRILVDKEFRTEVLSYVKDSVVMRFWNTEFLQRNERQRDETISPITNKVWQFLSSKIVRNIFGQPKSKLNLRKSMDEWKIILVNLSKWKIGEDNASMIWSLLVTKFQIDVMSRADVSFEQRKDFYLYIDEFQNFATQSFSTILSEARKYKLSLIIANQYTSQISEEVKDAIFGNVGTIISFALWHDDAKIISNQFKEMVDTNDLISLPRFHAYIKLIVDGFVTDPFSIKTHKLLKSSDSTDLIDKIKKQSRQRYSMPKDELEKLLNARNQKTFSATQKVSEKIEMQKIWISEKEIKNIQNTFVQQNLHLFQDFNINWIQPDAIIFDTNQSLHKIVWNNKIEEIENYAELKIKKWETITKKDGSKLEIFVNIFQHKNRENTYKKPIMIRTWTKEEVQKQIEVWYNSDKHLIFCPNIEKIRKSGNKISEEHISNSGSLKKDFWVWDIELGNRYEWYIKLKYNYWLFVSVKWVEWLLHKKTIITPSGLERKKYYNIWDKIRVKASEFKDINWEKKVIRIQN